MSTERTEQIEQTASEWLMQRDSGNWTEADQARLDEWLNASALNHVAYLRLELGWEEAQRLKALGAGISSDDPPPPGQWNLGPFFDTAAVQGHGGTAAEENSLPGAASARRGRTKSGGFRLVALAASVAVAVVVFWQFNSDVRAYKTPIGGTSSVPVPDGSKVTLNTNSQIRVDFTESERKIELRQGEAYFEVAKDPKRPFVVTVGRRRVIALGTQFSVRQDANDIQVVVTEGQVRIEDDATHTQPVLAAGGIARATEAGIWVDNKPLPEIEEQLSWRSGVLMFRDHSLADATAEFNRYNTRKFVLAAPEIGNLKIEGNFRATNIDAFARLLEQVYPVTIERVDGDKLVIRHR